MSEENTGRPSLDEMGDMQGTAGLCMLPPLCKVTHKLAHLNLASYPGLLTPAFVLQVTNAGVRRPGYEATSNHVLENNTC